VLWATRWTAPEIDASTKAGGPMATRWIAREVDASTDVTTNSMTVLERETPHGDCPASSWGADPSGVPGVVAPALTWPFRVGAAFQCSEAPTVARGSDA